MERKRREMEPIERSLHVVFGGDSIASEKHPSHNDDRFFADDIAWGVFDGVGGDEGSEQASEFASNFCQDALAALPWQMSRDDSAKALCEILELADKLLGTASPDAPISTTAVIARLFQGSDDPEDTYLQVAHAGDSRLYVVHQEMVFFQTLDHAGSTKDLDEDTQRRVQDALSEARFFNDVDSAYKQHAVFRNIIGSALQSWHSYPLLIRADAVDLLPGDTLVLTSDGIHDNLTTEEILECLRDEDPVSALIDGALVRSQEPRRMTIRDPFDRHDIREVDNFRAKADDMTAVVVHLS